MDPHLASLDYVDHTCRDFFGRALENSHDEFVTKIRVYTTGLLPPKTLVYNPWTFV